MTATSPSAAAPSPGQCLELGLLDEVAIDLVPVVMGAGNRPFFGQLSSEDVLLSNPTACIPGDRVTHLVLPVTLGAQRADTVNRQTRSTWQPTLARKATTVVMRRTKK